MFKHVPVLLNECIEGLNINPSDIYVDATLGRGGHSSEILKRLKDGHLYCFDQDQQAIDESKDRLSKISNHFTIIHANFSEMKDKLNELGVEKVNGILFDLGVSSAQFDDADRGFSYRYDAKLDMRMNKDNSLSAYDVVNTYSLQDITRVLKEYGEEKFAYQIAKNIVKARENKPIETTFQLVDIIKSSLPMKALSSKGHPAKQTFQAIRIEVNNELDALKKALKSALDLLLPNGRICVITFNSLEDRIVKNIFKEVTFEGEGSRVLPLEKKNVLFSIVNRKVIVPKEKELENNPRSKSAKLRIIERK